MPYDYEARHNRIVGRMREVNSHSVVYIRDEAEYTVTASVSEMKPEDAIRMGLSLDVRYRDYIITKFNPENPEAPGVLPEELGEPRHEDVIQDGSLICKVTPRDDKPVYRYTTQRRLAYRVYTIVIADDFSPDELSSSSSGS